MSMPSPRREESKLLDISFDQNVGQFQFFVQKDIQQTSFGTEAKNSRYRRTGYVSIHQQYGTIHFHRYAHGEINRTEAFSFSCKCAGNHDQVAILDHARTLVKRIGEQWPLDDAELLGYLRSSLLWRDDPILPHFCLVKRNAF